MVVVVVVVVAGGEKVGKKAGMGWGGEDRRRDSEPGLGTATGDCD